MSWCCFYLSLATYLLYLHAYHLSLASQHWWTNINNNPWLTWGTSWRTCMTQSNKAFHPYSPTVNSNYRMCIKTDKLSYCSDTVWSSKVSFPLCSSDVAVPHPDKKSVIMYVTSLFQVLPQTVSMEAIQEVETLPRATAGSITRVTTEEHYQIQTQQRFSQQVSQPCSVCLWPNCYSM